MQKNYRYLDVFCPWTGETVDVSPHRAARWTGKTVRTAQRWAGGGTISDADMAALRFGALGLLPDDRWRDFRLRGGALLHVDTGERWTPEELRASWVLFQQAADHRRMMRRQRAPVLELRPGGLPLRRAL